jgi:PAS domain S-box-containing protein
MEPQIRQLLERSTPDDNGSAAPRTRVPDAADRRPATNAPAGPTAAERRLKWVIESAPVGLVITDAAGDVLAANKAALALFGPERLDDVLKKPLSRLIAQEDRERLVGFIGDVCRGQAGTLEYELVRSDGTRRVMETRAVPLQREADAPTAFLSATWDVTERKRSAGVAQQVQSKFELVEAERDALKELLREAQAAQERLFQERAAEQQAISALREAGGKSQAAMAEAAERHRSQADEWSKERDSFLAKLKETEDRHQHQANQWSTERADLLTKLQAAEGRQQQTAVQLSSERDGLQAKLQETAHRLEHEVGQWSEEREKLHAKLQETLHRHQHAANQWSDERAALHSQLHDAEDRHEHAKRELAAERDALQTKLQEADDRHAALAGQMLAEQAARQASLAHAESRYEEALAAASVERQRVENALNEVRAHYDEIQNTTRIEREELTAAIEKLERRCDQLNEDRRAEREHLERELHLERSRLVTLLNERDRWQVELGESVEPLKVAGALIERLLSGNGHQLSFQMNDGADVAKHQPPVGAPIAMRESEEDEDSTWRF